MDHAAPSTLAQALALLAEHELTPVAGGTDFYPARVGLAPHDPVLDLGGVRELAGIDISDAGIRIGALTTWSEIASAPLPKACRALQVAARQVGGIQVQNAGTVGGNLCNASPAADGIPPLLVLDAEVEVASADGVRRLPLSDFLVGYRSTALGRGELLTAIEIPHDGLNGRSAFLKLGSRTHLVISIVMVAARIQVGPTGIIDQAAIAVGACSPVAARLASLEADLVGVTATEAASVVTADHLTPLAPIDDPRAPAEYRLQAARVLAARALDECASR